MLGISPYLQTLFILYQKRLIERLSFTKSHDYTPFIILCPARSGSTLLHTLLNAHPNVHSHGEILRHASEKTHHLPSGLLKNQVFKPYSKNIKAVGLKVFYEYSDQFKGEFAELTQYPNLKVIHLYRNNMLDAFLSLKKAELFQQWNDTQAVKNRSLDPVTIDPEKFKKYISEQTSYRSSVLSIFKDHEVLHISYEQLTSKKDQALEKVTHFLNISPKKMFSLLKKQNQEDHNTWVQNIKILRNVWHTP